MADHEQGSPSLEFVEHLLRRVPFFRALDRVDIARLIGALEEIHFSAGTLIFAEGAEADALYLLESGRVEVMVNAADEARVLAMLEGPSHFGELGLLLARRTASARAATDAHAWKLPRLRFEQLVRERTDMGLVIAMSLAELIEERSRQHVGAPVLQAASRGLIPRATPRISRSPMSRVLSGALALALPLVLWPVAPPGGLSPQGWHVSLIVLGGTVAWLFQTVPDFVVALAVAALWGITGLAPISLAFSGFASPTWVLALGAVGLAAAMARSGLLFRLALLLLRIFPPTHRGQVLALLTSGVFLTPLVPLAAARIATTALLGQELAQGLGYSVRGRASAALAFAGLIGYASFSTIFLTGLATNFFVLGLLPLRDRQHYDWLTWFLSAAPVGVVVFVGTALVLLLSFPAEYAPRVTALVLRRQQLVLGPLSRGEVVTVAALCVLLIGLLLQSVLRIDAAWLATAALVIVLAGGVLDRQGFRSSMEWGFLVFFGMLLGLGGVFRSVGVDQWIADRLVLLSRAVGNPSILVILLGVFVAGCRLILPRVPANFLLASALVPAAPRLGLSPWLIGFVVLTVGNTWLHPGQSDFYTLTRDVTKGEMFTDRQGIAVGVALTLLTLVSIAASIPYWRAIGLLSASR